MLQITPKEEQAILSLITTSQKTGTWALLPPATQQKPTRLKGILVTKTIARVADRPAYKGD